MPTAQYWAEVSCLALAVRFHDEGGEMTIDLSCSLVDLCPALPGEFLTKVGLGVLVESRRSHQCSVLTPRTASRDPVRYTP